MVKSARLLGQEFGGRTAAAMNLLPHDHGFLEGKPGAWGLTELGEKFAKWSDHDNGYGGYAHRAWSYITWDEKVTDALRASMKANPDGIVATAPTPAAVVTTIKSAVSAPTVRSAPQLLAKNKRAAAGLLALAGLGAAAPYVRRAWDEKVRPAAGNLRSRIAERNSEPSEPAASPDDAEQ